MLEIIIIAILLFFIGFQLRANQKQSRAKLLQQRNGARINIGLHLLDTGALHSARDKFFDHELYKLDENFADIEELTIRERRALEQELYFELVYFQNLHYQRENGLIEAEQSLSLNYMRCLMHAPHRRFWKDNLRLGGHFPDGFIRHVDGVVKLYDQVENVMDQDQDAAFESVVQSIFNIPAPPSWLD
ncbi:MAG: hypothetical protein JJ934_13525 [Pseudomonadales bacterium]|nr:hypothetical protein [Pseudomonadales bacterium]MBO6596986.1 hypothetical protein [Pseudomonadales bacterium]MBO6657915.1 hypothetical protein [Pseudomonadales bacterium]MBO6823828.1 hypothetical protein [Pseudomonadales bacterium]